MLQGCTGGVVGVRRVVVAVLPSGGPVTSRHRGAGFAPPCREPPPPRPAISITSPSEIRAHTKPTQPRLLRGPLGPPDRTQPRSRHPLSSTESISSCGACLLLAFSQFREETCVSPASFLHRVLTLGRNTDHCFGPSQQQHKTGSAVSILPMRKVTQG